MNPPLLHHSRYKDMVPESVLPAGASRLHELLATMWTQNQSTIADRLDVLRKAHRRLERRGDDLPTRKKGADAAHKLAGILGTFGLPRGTDLARQAEDLLEGGSALTLEQLTDLKRWVMELQSMIEQKSLATTPTNS